MFRILLKNYSWTLLIRIRFFWVHIILSRPFPLNLLLSHQLSAISNSRYFELLSFPQRVRNSEVLTVRSPHSRSNAWLVACWGTFVSFSFCKFTDFALGLVHTYVTHLTFAFYGPAASSVSYIYLTTMHVFIVVVCFCSVLLISCLLFVPTKCLKQR